MRIDKLSFGDLYNTTSLFHICKKDFNKLEIPYYPTTHWHDYIEIEIILDGSATNIQNNVEYKLEPRDAFVSAYDDFHKFIPGAYLKTYNISFAEELVDKNLLALMKSNKKIIQRRFNKSEMFAVGTICELLIDAQEHTTHISDEAAKYAVLFILMLIYQNAEMTKASGRMEQIVEYINQNIDKDLSLNSIAEKYSLSPNYLGNLFKKYMGISYNSYINKVRIRYACNILAATNLPIKEVVTVSGYASIEYFFYNFKKIMNMTPAQYRKENSLIR